MCGEQKQVMRIKKAPKGSPPRVRGTAGCFDAQKSTPGITPACAGNRQNLPHAKRLFLDHPRVCGEQVFRKRSANRDEGSPPRVRGTVGEVMIRERGARITPACAGNRPPGANHAPDGQDHPRVCGEQMRPGMRPGELIGSPPRVRGTDRWCARANRAHRITPACAGNRYLRPPAHLHRQDHPRVCGEQRAKKKPFSVANGSPPRVRGTE